MKTLLVIVNELVKSKKFIRYAVRLGRDMHMNVQLMYIQNPESYPLGVPGTIGVATAQVEQVLQELMSQADQQLEKMVIEMQKEIDDDIMIRHSSSVGLTKFIIDQYIRDKKADIVVLESKDQGTFMIQDATIMDIVRNVSCPVWIIPEESAYHPMRKILYATDYHQEDVPTIKKLLDLTQPLGPVITSLHVTKSNDFEDKLKSSGFIQMVQSKAGSANIDMDSVIEPSSDEISHVINEYAGNKTMDLIVLLKENRGFLESIFKPSQSKRVIKDAKIPVLVFHE